MSPVIDPEERGCYCRTATHGPGNPPDGFCGFCDRCGRPGHLRHHPGAPVTGAWCDRHFRHVVLLHPLAPVGRWVWRIAVAAALFIFGWWLR